MKRADISLIYISGSFPQERDTTYRMSLLDMREIRDLQHLLAA